MRSPLRTDKIAHDSRRFYSVAEVAQMFGMAQIEPDAVRVARPVLRGPRRGNAPGLPDNTAAGHIGVLRDVLR